MAPLANLGRPPYCRRDFVASAAASVASCVLGRALPAYAQGEVDEAVSALNANLKDADELFQEVIYKI
jgi:hypothetical protein